MQSPVSGDKSRYPSMEPDPSIGEIAVNAFSLGSAAVGGVLSAVDSRITHPVVPQRCTITLRDSQCALEPDESIDYWLHNNGLNRFITPGTLQGAGVDWIEWIEFVNDLEYTYRNTAPEGWCCVFNPCLLQCFFPLILYCFCRQGCLNSKFEGLANRWNEQWRSRGLAVKMHKSKLSGMRGDGVSRDVGVHVFDIVRVDGQEPRLNPERYRVVTTDILVRRERCCNEHDEGIDFWLEKKRLDRCKIPRELAKQGVPLELWLEIVDDIEKSYRKYAPNGALCCLCAICVIGFFYWGFSSCLLWANNHRVAEKLNRKLAKYRVQCVVRTDAQLGNRNPNQQRPVGTFLFQLVNIPALQNEVLDAASGDVDAAPGVTPGAVYYEEERRELLEGRVDLQKVIRGRQHRLNPNCCNMESLRAMWYLWILWLCLYSLRYYRWYVVDEAKKNGEDIPTWGLWYYMADGWRGYNYSNNPYFCIYVCFGLTLVAIKWCFGVDKMDPQLPR